MTNYNDGNWHGWNGGECPVHPDTVVDVVLDNGALVKGEPANKWFWDTDNTCIIAFRVIKEHKEPREFYACEFVEIDIMGNERKTFWEQCDKDEEGAVLFREVPE